MKNIKWLFEEFSVSEIYEFIEMNALMQLATLDAESRYSGGAFGDIHPIDLEISKGYFVHHGIAVPLSSVRKVYFELGNPEYNPSYTHERKGKINPFYDIFWVADPMGAVLIEKTKPPEDRRAMIISPNSSEITERVLYSEGPITVEEMAEYGASMNPHLMEQNLRELVEAHYASLN